MKFKLLVLTILSFTCFASYSQHNLKGIYLNNELQIKLSLNLYDDNIPVPGFELDSCYGYLQGRINGNWIILQVKSIDKNEAVVRAVSEKGSDAQDLLVIKDDDKIIIRQIKGSSIKEVSGRKYTKLPKDLFFEK